MLFPLSKPSEFSRPTPPSSPPLVPHFFSFQSPDTLAVTLANPHKLFIEIGPYTMLESLLESLLPDMPDILLAITTVSAYRYCIAEPLSAMLNKRFGLQGHKSTHIETCIHEALLNAVIHGNLTMRSMFGSLDEMDAFYAQMETYLSLDEYKFRRIYVRAWDRGNHLKIAISDEGNGFTLTDDTMETGLPHGRGLHFIRSLADHVWVGDDRRTLYMTFSY